MRTLLRNRATGFYFRGVADWTKDLGIAFDFGTPERAARFVAAACLNAREMELILAFKDPRYNVPLPLDERYGVRELAQKTPTRLVSTGPGLQWLSFRTSVV
jgi:hypothetical protein